MDAFDDIRPYTDSEMPQVLGRLADDAGFVRLASNYVTPWLSRWLPGVAHRVVRRVLKRRIRKLATVSDLQVALSRYVEKILNETTEGLSFSGVEALDPNRPYLFISNHRDIVCDPAIVNFTLWKHGFETSQIAIGDNLLNEGFETDLMRLNKSFVIRRGEKGARAQLAAMTTTSKYVKQTLEAGESVWIAHREGRTKDGYDRTEAAIFKMFALAYGRGVTGFRAWRSAVELVPVSISYEIDPCALLKAKELFMTERDGEYVKAAGEDLLSIQTGISGFKGRVHVAFGAPVDAAIGDVDSLTRHVDAEIVGSLENYPTHEEAHARLEDDSVRIEMSTRVRAAFDAGVDFVGRDLKPHLLKQYANQIENKRRVASEPAQTG